MRNYTLLFSFLFLFVVSDLDAQRRSGRASKRIDESKNVENVKPDDDLYKKFGFSSRDQLVEFLLEKDLSRSEKRTVEKYGKGKKLSKSQTRQFRGLLKKYAEEREVSQAGRSGRVSSDRALSGSGRGSSASRAPSRGRSGRVSGDRALSGSGRASATRTPTRGRSGRQAADMDYDCDPNQDYPQMDPGPDGGCADYADCNGNGVFDVGEPCYEGDDQGPSFDEVDANGDGSISREEARAFFGNEDDFDEQFDDVDQNNNGSVSMDEWEDALSGDEEHDGGEHHGDMDGMDHEDMDGMDHDCDPNHDYPQMDPGPDGGCADYADCNGNGVFDVGEPCYEGDDQGPSFDEVDANNDGEISYSEAQAVFGQEPDFDERFNEVDSDNNGSVDMAEWEAAGDNDQNDGQ